MESSRVFRMEKTDSSPSTKMQILTKTLQLISENPSKRYSISDLKRATGLSTGSFYHFFPRGADDILQDLYLMTLEDLKDSILKGTDEMVSTEMFIRKGVENFLEWHLKNTKESIFLNSQSDSILSTRTEEAFQIRQAFGLRLSEKLSSIFTKEFQKKKLEQQIIIPAFFGSCQEFIKSWQAQGRPKALIKNAKIKMADFLYAGLRK